MTLQESADNNGTVALLIGGNVIEDFLDPIGVSLGAFCDRFVGSWIFGYGDALRLAGWRPIMVVVSRRMESPKCFEHSASGMRIWVLPAWKAYEAVTRSMIDPYGWTIRDTFGPVTGPRRIRCFVHKELAPYLSTPLGSLVRVLRREKCTAILTQEYEHARFDACVWLGKILHLPVYASFQGSAWHTGRLEDLVRPFSLRAACGLAIAPSSEARRVTETYGVKAERIWRIPNPVDANFWQAVDREQARSKLGFPNDVVIVIYHGRIAMHHKGLDVLLGAWERICARSSGKNIRLLIIGSGKDDALLQERLMRPGLSGVGWLNRFEHDRSVLRTYISAADISVLPSRVEGFPVAPLEAMACGIPFIGSDIPPMLDILENGTASGGLIAPREDPGALADAIQRLIDHPDLRQELGQNARRNVITRFSMETVGRQLGEMLSPLPST